MHAHAHQQQDSCSGQPPFNLGHGVLCECVMNGNLNYIIVDIQYMCRQFSRHTALVHFMDKYMRIKLDL